MRVFLLLLIIFTPAFLWGQNYCELCHSDVKVEYQQSVHSNEGLTCASCHGGNATADTEKEAHSGNFRNLKDRLQNPAACASCHSDSQKMRPYGLPTDQFVLYQTSVHGKRLQAGDAKVAVCVDCHGVHKILPPTDPESKTHPRNIPDTCGTCHANKDLMKNYHLSETIVSDYMSGVHGKAMQDGNRQAPVCTSCHGTHGAAPPGIGDVTIVCGHCHEAVRDYFRTSPHQKAMADAGIAECVACHGNHKIPKVAHSMWISTCKECHADKSDQINRGEQIRTLMTQAQEEIDKANEIIRKAAEIPLDVSDYQAGLEDARTYMVEALPVSHSLKVQDVEDLTRRSRSIAVEIQSEIHERERIFQDRRLGLILAWFYILLSIVIVYEFKKQLQRPS